MVYAEFTLEDLCDGLLAATEFERKTSEQYEQRIRNIAQMLYDGRKKGARKDPPTDRWKSVNAYEFFSQTQTIEKLITDNYPNNSTATGFYTAFKSVIAKLNLVRKKGLSMDVLRFYEKLMTAGSKTHEATKLSNLGNKASFVMHDGKILTWEVIKKKTDEYFEEILVDDWDESLNRVFAFLYTEMPPRRLEDYREMVLYSNHKDFEESVEYNKAEIDVKHKKVIMRIGRYKNWKKYGAFQVVLDKKYASRLADAIVSSYVHFPRRYLICKTKDGKPIDAPSTQMSKDVSELFNFIVRGSVKAEKDQNISANILRHDYITWWYQQNPNPSGAQMLELAKKMGHSVSMSQGYRMLDKDEIVDLDTDDEEEDVPLARRKTTTEKEKAEAKGKTKPKGKAKKEEEATPPSTPEKSSEASPPSTPEKSSKVPPPKKTEAESKLKKRTKKIIKDVMVKDTGITYTKQSIRKMKLDELIEKYQNELKREHELGKELELIEAQKRVLEQLRKAANERIDQFEEVIADAYDETSKAKKD